MRYLYKKISLILNCTDGSTRVETLSIGDGLKLTRTAMVQEWARFTSWTYKDVPQTRIERDRFFLGREFLLRWLGDTQPKSMTEIEGKWLYHLGSAMLNEKGASVGLRDVILHVCAASKGGDSVAGRVAAHYVTTELRMRFFRSVLEAGRDPLQARFSKHLIFDIQIAVKEMPRVYPVHCLMLQRLAHAVNAIETQSADGFVEVANTLHGLLPHLSRIRSGLSLPEASRIPYAQLRNPGGRQSLLLGHRDLSTHDLECHGQNGQNVYNVVTHLRDTLRDLETIKAVVVTAHSAKSKEAHRQSAMIMVRALFELEKPIAKVLDWIQKTPRHPGLDWATATCLDDMSVLIGMLWDFGLNTTPGMIAMRDRWLDQLQMVSASCVCTVS